MRCAGVVTVSAVLGAISRLVAGESKAEPAKTKTSGTTLKEAVTEIVTAGGEEGKGKAVATNFKIRVLKHAV